MPSRPADHLDALKRVLATFPKETMRRAATYLAEGRVLAIRKTEHGFAGSVRGTQVYWTEWNCWNQKWWSECSCPMEGNCKHAFAVATHLLATGLDGSAPKPLLKRGGRSSPDERLLAKQLGRPLRVPELEIVAGFRKIYDTAVLRRWNVRIGPGEWTFLRLDPDHAKALQRLPAYDWRLHAPESLYEFLQHCTAHLDQAGIKFPWLAKAVNLEGFQTVFRERQAEAEIQEWTRSFTLRKKANRPALGEIRLRWAKGRFQWERSGGTGLPFAKLTVTALHQYSYASVSDLLAMDARSRNIIGLLRAIPGLPKISLNPGVPADAMVLHHYLSLEEMRTRIVGTDGEPIPRAEEPLVWKFSPRPGSPDYLDIKLANQSGMVMPPAVWSIPGDPSYYFDGQQIYLAPSPITSKNSLGPHSLPVAALQRHPEHALQLREEKAILPVELVPVTREEELIPRAEIELLSMQGGSAYLAISFSAVTDNFQWHWRYSHQDWVGPIEWGTIHRQADGTLIKWNGSRARQAAECLVPARFTWYTTLQKWAQPFQGSLSAEFESLLKDWQALDVRLAYSPDLAVFFRDPRLAVPRLTVERAPDHIDWFDVSIDWGLDDLKLSPKEIKMLLAADGRAVELPGRGWHRIKFEFDDAWRAALQDLGFQEDDPAELEPQRYHAIQLASARLGRVWDEGSLRKLQARAEQLVHRPVEAPAEGFLGSLRPYQLEGLNFLHYLSANGLGGILADDMGLGKTVQTIAWLAGLAAADPGKFSALIVCPKSTLRNWESEVRRFAPTLAVQIIGPESSTGPAPQGVVLTNYTQLRFREQQFREARWTAVILDEAQNIKNPQSTTSQLVRELKSSHRLCLTGTPIENRPLDLWSIMAFAQPGLLGSMASFKRLYDSKSLENPAHALGRLQKRVRHFMLRRTKGQVATDLPERIEEDVWVDLEDEQKALYEAELKKARSFLLKIGNQKDLIRSRFNVLQSLLRLRQICCDPRLRMKAGAGRSGSAKLQALWDQVGPLLEEGHKVLIFSQFVEMLNILRKEFLDQGITPLMLTGQTENRQEIIAQFQDDPKSQVFLLSLKAGGVGLNLTAASYVILYDPWWNPAVEAQAIDRAHRIGQKKTVIAYRLVAKGTIEEKIRILQKKKSALAASIVQEESLATVLDWESLRFLLAEDEQLKQAD